MATLKTQPAELTLILPADEIAGKDAVDTKLRDAAAHFKLETLNISHQTVEAGVEYHVQLFPAGGTRDNATVLESKFRNALKEQGLDKYLAEPQKQIS